MKTYLVLQVSHDLSGFWSQESCCCCYKKAWWKIPETSRMGLSEISNFLLLPPATSSLSWAPGLHCSVQWDSPKKCCLELRNGSHLNCFQLRDLFGRFLWIMNYIKSFEVPCLTFRTHAPLSFSWIKLIMDMNLHNCICIWVIENQN